MVLCIFATVLSIANYMFCVGQYSFTTRPSSIVYGSGLELASSYIGLDKHQSLEPGHIGQNYTLDNMPLVVGTVDREHPSYVHPDETPHWKSSEGMVIPDRRHILVSEAVSRLPLHSNKLNSCNKMRQLFRYRRLFNSVFSNSVSNFANPQLSSRPLRPSLTRTQL